MDSKINVYNFLKLRLFLLPVVLTLISLLLVTKCEYAAALEAQVGGNVTFYCTKDVHPPLAYMYLQKGGVFVNGFHSSKDITDKWPNTEVDAEAEAVHMYNLNVSHEGDYQCHTEFTGGDLTPPKPLTISLRLTAPYSKPSISSRCSDEGHSCLVECSSHSGYPSAEVMWNATVSGSNSSRTWRSENSSAVNSQDTFLVNISSTEVFNCSAELIIGCSVRGVTSDTVSICAAQSPSHSFTPVMAAVVVAVVAILAAGSLLWWKKKKRQSRTTAGSHTKERPINNEEVTAIHMTSAAS